MTDQEVALLYTFLGFRIKDLREKAEIKQDVFADNLGLSRASIINIEKGRHKPSLHLLLHMCKILKVDVSAILDPLNTSCLNGRSFEQGDWEQQIVSFSDNNSDTIQKLTEFVEVA